MSLIIVQANILAMEHDEANYETFNVGSGRSTSILHVAKVLAEKLGKDTTPVILEKFRAGDIRSCYSDITKISSRLRFKPTIDFEQGVDAILDWLRNQTPQDRTSVAISELEKRNLSR